MQRISKELKELENSTKSDDEADKTYPKGFELVLNVVALALSIFLIALVSFPLFTYAVIFAQIDAVGPRYCSNCSATNHRPIQRH